MRNQARKTNKETVTSENSKKTHTLQWKDKKCGTADNFDSKTGRDKLKKGNSKDTDTRSSSKNQTGHSKEMNKNPTNKSVNIAQGQNCNRMQRKRNNFLVKYGNRKNEKNAESHKR